MDYAKSIGFTVHATERLIIQKAFLAAGLVRSAVPNYHARTMDRTRTPNTTLDLTGG